MKKIVFASILALAALSASAVEVGVSAVRDYNLASNGIRATVGAVALPLGIKGALEATHVDENGKSYTQYGVAATREIVKVGPVALGAKLGAGYLDRNFGRDGYVATVGLGAAYSLTKSADITVGAERRYGQHRVSDMNGNVVTAGLTYKF